MYTASTAFLESLVEAGVSYIFANFGSDHPALLEAIADARASGREIPHVITCPFEMVGLAAAHGHTMVSGKIQAVFVHVDCGTQSLAGAVHNAARARIPVLLYAGLSPATQEGELRGSRNEFIQWIQDAHDQRGLVRDYVKYSNEFRTSANIKQVVHRALQIAGSDPKGPVYLVGAREIMEQEAQHVAINTSQWAPVRPSALPADGVQLLVEALAGARRPLVVTSHVGKNVAAVAELESLCDRLGIGVLDSVPSAMNCSHRNPLYQGSQWNQPVQSAALAEADVILVIESDVPWIPAISKPADDARIFHIDVDPLKRSMPLWYIRATSAFQADALTALRQLNAALAHVPLDAGRIGERRAHYVARHARRAQQLLTKEQSRDRPTIEHLMACLRAHLQHEGLVLSEAITNYPQVCDHLAPVRPGSYFASGGGSLGWNGGAAIGAKLAAPDQTVVSITGDGSYMFSVPSSVHWMARRYDTPFLQVVLNNGGWQAPRLSTLSVHPDGYAARGAPLDLDFAPAPEYGAIAAAAGNAYARVVDAAADVPEALAATLRAVREERRCAVLDIRLNQETESMSTG